MPYPASLITFDTYIDNTDYVLASHFNKLQTITESLQAKVGTDSSDVDTSLDYKIRHFFVEGVRILYFYEDTPPTGWATTGMPGDVVVGVKGGTQDYLSVGATVVATWTWPAHTLTLAELPSHVHIWNRETNRPGYSPGIPTAVPIDIVPNVSYPLASEFTDGPHTHGSTTFRPNAALGIFAKYTG